MTRAETARVAVRALRLNVLRSTLTMLGVVIGTGAVIAMVAIGEGAKARVETTFAAMGTNLLIVLPGSSASGGLQLGFGSQPTLTWGDLAAVRAELPAVRTAAPASRATAPVQAEEQNWTTTLVGSTPEYFDVRSLAVDQGRALAQGDVDAGAKVVVLGRTVVGKLWGAGASPVGQVVRIRRTPYEVVGVLAPKGQSPMGQDYDDLAILPISTFQAKVQGGLGQYVNGILMVSARSAEDTGRAQAQVEGLLRDRHRIQPGVDDDFSVRNLSEIASAQKAGARVLTTLLASIAAVSLVVGGIGITNIMLVSVTERTREIGLRMAVGARPRDIRAQFVVEALALSCAGGLTGVALGLGVAWQLSRAFHWPLVVRPLVVLVAIGFSALVGVAFGLYPARKASRLDPIEALRYE